MFLFVGIGNKGEKYNHTRHNIGFEALDVMCRTFDFTPTEVQKFLSVCFTFQHKGEKIMCIKPQTFVNLSGSAVLQVASFYKINPEDIFVFHDEVELEVGRIKFKTGGGNAGHNGLKSIDEVIGKEYNRVRIGVGRPPEKDDLAGYVLAKFKKTEEEEICCKLKMIFQNLDLLLAKDFDKLLNLLHLNKV